MSRGRMFQRAALLFLLSMIGCVAVASGMIISELGNAYAALTRLMAGGIAGVIIAPLIMATMWRKPIAMSMLTIFLPPMIVGLICLANEPEDGYFHVAVPLIFVSCLLTALVLPGKARDPTVCVSCGYDLRGSASLRCPECGWDRAQPLPPPWPFIARMQEIHTVIWLAAAALSATGTVMFFSWLKSLG